VLDAIVQLVKDAAIAELIPRFTEVVKARRKADGSLITEADLAVQQVIRAGLEPLDPGTAFLGEESDVAEQQAVLDEAPTFWCLDPLDGTTNFTRGVPLFAVSLVRMEAGQPTLAVTYDPIRDECFTARRGEGAQVNGEPLRLDATPDLPLRDCVALVDFKRLKRPLAYHLLDESLFASQRNIGTCALEWAWLAAGRGQLYLHGGQRLWDFAAGCLLLAEAGGTSSTLDGEAVFRASRERRSVVAASQATMHGRWLEAVSAV
jgi:myo-inositol-1(or 4)-monophosphatase